MAIQNISSEIYLKNNPLVCYHCGSSIIASEVIEENIAGKKELFCCVGCLSIAKMIYEQGLDIFYSRREKKDFSANRPNPIDQERKAQCLVYDHPTLVEKYAPRLQEDHFLRKTTLRIENIQCAACVWLNEQHWRKLVGVHDVEINYMSQRAVIQFDDRYIKLSDLLMAAQQIGYQAWPFELSQSSQLAKKAERSLLLRLGVALLGMMQVMMYVWPTYNYQQDIDVKYQGLMGWAGWLLTIPVIFYSAAPIFKNAYKSLLYFSQTKSLHMDVPIAIALGLSWVVGTGHLFFQFGATYFDSITMFVALLLLARFIELKARHQTQSSIEALAMQLPETCNLVKDFVNDTAITEKVPIHVLNSGDTLQVFPGEVIPVDGIVIRQSVYVSEAILTGESKAIEKQVGEKVFAGSYNLESTLYCQVIATGAKTKIGAIATLLEQALSQKPKYASFSEKLASYFVLTLLLIAVLTGGIWSLLGQEQAWERALAVLVVTCPCAISLAVPLALAASHGLLAKYGLVVVSPDGIEKLNNFDTIFLDKTGTVTTGELRIEKVDVYDASWTQTEVIRIARILEADQNHPIAKAILGESNKPTFLEGFAQTLLGSPKVYQTGRGLTCGDWQLGSPSWVVSSVSNKDLLQTALANISPGTTPVCLSYQHQLIAIFSLRDTLRTDVKKFIEKMKVMGKTPYLISGDDEISVHDVAKSIHIPHYFANCTPEDKLRYVEEFQSRGKKILAIGDGVNDAPLLAMANISVAFGEAAPLSQSGADLILFKSQFHVVSMAIIHAKNTQVIIRQNLLWGLTYNLIALPLAILGYVSPLGAAAGMSVSSIVVCLNASRLGKLQNKFID